MDLASLKDSQKPGDGLNSEAFPVVSSPNRVVPFIWSFVACPPYVSPLIDWVYLASRSLTARLGSSTPVKLYNIGGDK